MSDVDRLRDELALAEELEKLEAARKAMHADRSPKNVKAYKAIASKVAEARKAHREAFGAPPATDGDGVATPDTVHASAEVQS